MVHASAGIEGGTGIGAGSCGYYNDKGDMKATITIDCGENSSINAYGFDKEILEQHPDDYNKYLLSQLNKRKDSYFSAGIGSGDGGNMKGTVIIKGGNVNVWSGLFAAAIGGGNERGIDCGAGGDVYIGGGTINIYTYTSPSGGSMNEAIGSCASDFGKKSGSVYINKNNNRTGKYMRVIYYRNKNDQEEEWTKTAAADDRSKLCHKNVNLVISECPHTDHNGNSGLTYTINGDGTHTVKCKYCGYEKTEEHTGSDCACGYSNPNKTVKLISAAGYAESKVAEGNSFTLPYSTGDIITANTNPPTYSQVKGWTLSGDETGAVFVPGSDVTVTSDMTFNLVTEPVFSVQTTDAQNGTISSDPEYAKPGDTVQFSVEPDFGYSVSSVSYKYIEGFNEEPEDSGIYIPYYSSPVVINADSDGKYQLTMPNLPDFANGIIVSAEFTKDPNHVFISDIIENGTITSDKETAEENGTVTLTIAPDEGYKLKDVRCKKQDGTEVELTKVNDTTFTFAMPNESVIVSAEFDFSDGVGARLIGHTLSLEGNIGVNFYMDLEDSVANSDTAYMYFTIPGDIVTYQTVYVNEQSDASLPHAETKEVGGKTYYVFPCSVAAKEMTSDITAQIIDGDDHGDSYTYSVKEYADYLLEHADDKGTDEEKAYYDAAPLVEKMLQYGAYAEEYFENTEKLDNLEDVNINIAAPEIGTFPEGTTFEGATLSLESETTLSLYFKSNTTLTFSCADYNVETITSRGYQIARIIGIKSKQIGSVITLNVGDVQVKYSPLNYCKKVLAEPAVTSDEEQAQHRRLVNAVKALYAYWLAADSYFD